MDSIDGKYYFICVTKGCKLANGPLKISENLVILEEERRLKHTVTFLNIRNGSQAKKLGV